MLHVILLKCQFAAVKFIFMDVIFNLLTDFHLCERTYKLTFLGNFAHYRNNIDFCGEYLSECSAPCLNLWVFVPCFHPPQKVVCIWLNRRVYFHIKCLWSSEAASVNKITGAPHK